jgi:hypothetical protein
MVELKGIDSDRGEDYRVGLYLALLLLMIILLFELSLQ